MGCTFDSRSFFLSLRSSGDASLLLSSHEIASSTASSIVFFSSSEIFPPSFSLSPI
jgi:hypothetical protein